MSSSVPSAARSLGALRQADGSVEFRVFSAHAEEVELCLFERRESIAPSHRFRLEREDALWTFTAPEAPAGTLYGYRVHGEFAPPRGHWFNSSKLLIDPYALAITGEPRADPSLFGFAPGTAPERSFDSADSAVAMPKCVLVDEAFDWQGVTRPEIPWRDTVLYETHVKGQTWLHPKIPSEIRGTYLGFCHPVMIDHWRQLGVTTLELMPVCQFASEAHLLASGRRNYWGYSPLGYFAPHAAYAMNALGGQVAEFKTMVRELHRAGFEIVLDMVFNHTVEGGGLGPTLSFKGIDNRSYYRLEPRNLRRYVDYTGCGNTLDCRQPVVRDLFLDVLRYWAGEVDVDGFRLDLAPVLGRDPQGFDPRAPFFAAIAADPLLSQRKWLAEPWDLGPGGYQAGRFPPPWREWNDRFRNTVRRFFRSGGTGESRGEVTADLATRLAGSPDVYGKRAPGASVNYVCAHDGFTLVDLTSYERKHNAENGENNRDGFDANFSANWGVEGPTTDSAILGRRKKAAANLIATLMLSAGVPMLSHGDELGRSQGGNNNAYCQDNATTWLDWAAVDGERLALFRRLLQIRRDYPILRSEAVWRPAHTGRGKGPVAIWYGLDGEPLSPERWRAADHTSFGLWLDPAQKRGAPEGIFAFFHGATAVIQGRFPPALAGRPLSLLFYSASPSAKPVSARGLADWTLDGLSVAIFAVGKP
jgi:isoamylase